MQNLVKNEKVRAVWGADIAALLFYELYNIADAAVGKAHLLQAIGAYTFFLHGPE